MEELTLTEEQLTLLRRRILFDAQSAAERRFCKRKGVGCSLWSIDRRGGTLDHETTEFNSGLFDEPHCTGERGNCGCAHAEPRAVAYAMSCSREWLQSRFLMLTCNYSPCSACAHAIAASRVISAVFYFHATKHDLRGLEILRRYGIRAVQLPNGGSDAVD